MKTYLLGTDLSNFKYDDFIFVLDVISRYTDVVIRLLKMYTNLNSEKTAQLIKVDIYILMPTLFLSTDSLKSTSSCGSL